MGYLSPSIAAKAKRNKGKSLVKKTISCGIFQDLGTLDQAKPKNDKD